MDGVWTSCFLSNCILVHCESQRAKMGKRIRMRNKNLRNEKKSDIHTYTHRKRERNRTFLQTVTKSSGCTLHKHDIKLAGRERWGEFNEPHTHCIAVSLAQKSSIIYFSFVICAKISFYFLDKFHLQCILWWWTGRFDMAVCAHFQCNGYNKIFIISLFHHIYAFIFNLFHVIFCSRNVSSRRTDAMKKTQMHNLDGFFVVCLPVFFVLFFLFYFFPL